MRGSEQGIFQKRERFWFGAFFLLSLALYFPAFRNFFINDDFLHLDFVRSFRGSYLEFFLPHVRPSDVVTHARYEPFHMIFYGFLFSVLGANFYAYQLLNIFLHGLNAFLVYKAGKKIGLSARAAVIGGLFFCASRLNSQNVLWYALLFCNFALTVQLTAFLLYLNEEKPRPAWIILLVVTSALLTLRTPQWVLLAAVYTMVYFKEIQKKGALLRCLKILAAAAGVCLLSALGNAVSWHYFPNRIPGFEFDFQGAGIFFLNLVFPYEAPLFLKAAAAGLLLAAVLLRRKDKTILFCAAAIAANAFFWFLLFSAAHLPYAPRYFYLASVFFSLLLAQILEPAWQRKGWRAAATAIFCGVFILGNAALILSQDIVWFRYLSVRGKKLEEISKTVPANAARKKVFIKDDFFSGDPNLDYYKDKIEFVNTEGLANGEVTSIDLEREYYFRYFGRDFGRQYWFQPWFINKKCGADTPWC